MDVVHGDLLLLLLLLVATIVVVGDALKGDVQEDGFTTQFGDLQLHEEGREQLFTFLLLLLVVHLLLVVFVFAGLVLAAVSNIREDVISHEELLRALCVDTATFTHETHCVLH